MKTSQITCDSCGHEYDGTIQNGCPLCQLKMGLQPESPTVAMPPESIAAEELAGKFEHLEVLDLLGAGGMGAVYTARQTKLDRIVALKVVRPDISDSEEFAQRFEREAKALARLNHPNIVSIYDFGNVDGLFYYIMEHVDGTNLAELAVSENLSPTESLEIVSQVCSAIQYAHENGVVHRDIKPTNILLNSDGLVKIADFGLAKLCSPGDLSKNLTQTRQVFGTPNYMAPEQIEAAKEVDHRADIYSLGVVFYELLTGELPLGRFDPPSAKINVDVRLDEVVLRALEKHPERRYQAAREFKTDISQFANAQPVPPVKSINQPTTVENNSHEFAPWYVAALTLAGAILLALSINGITQYNSYRILGTHTNSIQLIASQSFAGILPGILFLILGRYLWQRSRPEHWTFDSNLSPVQKLISYRLAVYTLLCAILIAMAMPWIHVKYHPVDQEFLGVDTWVGRSAFYVCLFTVALLVFIDIYEGTGIYFYLCLIASGAAMMLICSNFSQEMKAPHELVCSTELRPPELEFTSSGRPIIPRSGLADLRNGYGFCMTMFMFMIGLGSFGPFFKKQTRDKTIAFMRAEERQLGKMLGLKS